MVRRLSAAPAVRRIIVFGKGLNKQGKDSDISIPECVVHDLSQE